MAEYADTNFDWSDIHDAFMLICKAASENNGQGKIGDGYFELKFLPKNMHEEQKKPYIVLEFGGYQIDDWSRHQEFGPYLTIKEAWDAAVQRVREAYDSVNSELKEEGRPIKMYPAVLL